MLISGCTSLPQRDAQLDTFSIPLSTDSWLKNQIEPHTSRDDSHSGFQLLSDGLEAFAARAGLISTAEHTIDVQYYFIRYDLAGSAFMGLLLEAADRGVRVRVLLDDYYLGNKDELLLALDGHPNLEIRTFNPFSRGTPRFLQYTTKFGELSRRMHNKSFIVDGQIAILGGRNIGDEYFAASSAIEFGDLDVAAIGPIVQETSFAFDSYWNHPLAYNMSVLLKKKVPKDTVNETVSQIIESTRGDHIDPYRESIIESDFVADLTNNNLVWEWAPSSLVVDSPDKLLSARSETELQLLTQITPLFENAQAEVLVFSPYFVPRGAGTNGIVALQNKGVNVSVLTNSAESNNVGMVHAHYSKSRKRLLDAGVKLYEIKRYSSIPLDPESGTRVKDVLSTTLHAKSFVIDRRIVYIGSFNFDPRSATENTEIGVVIESKEIGEGMADWFNQSVKNIAYELKLDDSGNINWIKTDSSQTSVLKKEPNTSAWKRFKLKMMGWLPVGSLM